MLDPLKRDAFNLLDSLYFYLLAIYEFLGLRKHPNTLLYIAGHFDVYLGNECLDRVRACLNFIISPANPSFWNFAAFIFSLIALLLPLHGALKNTLAKTQNLCFSA